MSSRDKNKLIILGALIGCILISVFFIFATKAVPIWLVVGILVFLECFVLVPMVSSKYYEVHGMKDSWTRWIPIWNEIQIVDPKAAYGTLICGILAVLALVASKLPLDVVAKIFSLQTMFSWGSNCMVFSFIFLAVANLFLGLGIMGVLKSVNRRLIEKLNVRFNAGIEAVYCVLALIPFVRLGTLVTINQKLDSLIQSIATERKQEFVREEV